MRSDNKEAASSAGGGGLEVLDLSKPRGKVALTDFPTFFFEYPLEKKKKIPLHTLQVKPKVKRYGTIHTYCFVSGFSNTGLVPKLSLVIFPYSQKEQAFFYICTLLYFVALKMGWGDLFLCKLVDIVNLHWLARMLKKKGVRPRFPPPFPHFGEQSIC